MSESIKKILTQYEPEPPQLDWKAIWIEQGRAEAQVEQMVPLDQQLRHWKSLSLVSLTVTATLLVALTVAWSAMNRSPFSSTNDTAARPDSTARSEVASGDQHLASGTRPLPAAPFPSQDPAHTPELPTYSWLASWHPIDLQRDLANRQRLLARGLAGFEAYDSTSSRPAALQPPSTQTKALNYKDLLERYLRLPHPTTSDALRQGDWL